jgi:predicted amidophosphoribosyltransferase
MSIDNKVIVSVSGGIAEFVAAPEGIECYLIDWDLLEDNYCPLCSVELDDITCPECKFEFTYDEYGHQYEYSEDEIVKNYCKIKGIE